MTFSKHRKTRGEITDTMRESTKQQIRDFRGLMFSVGFNRFFVNKPQEKLQQALKTRPPKAIRKKNQLERSSLTATQASPPPASTGNLCIYSIIVLVLLDAHIVALGDAVLIHDFI